MNRDKVCLASDERALILAYLRRTARALEDSFRLGATDRLLQLQEVIAAIEQRRHYGEP